LERIILSWSGGKDSCMALKQLRDDGEVEVAGLLTTITADHDRISMHGVRRELLHAQAIALGLPLHEVLVPAKCSNANYEAAMGAALDMLKGQGIATVAFGDLFLEDIRAYRDAKMQAVEMKTLYPVWGRDTGAFIEEFIALGFHAVTVCVDLAKLDESFSGRLIDDAFLAELPDGIDPCGENGEFHTFVFDGPLFSRPIEFAIGERVSREGFSFCDLESVAAESYAAAMGGGQ
jgi:uncharacterized protein (TIGR00290 family)